MPDFFATRFNSAIGCATISCYTPLVGLVRGTALSLCALVASCSYYDSTLLSVPGSGGSPNHYGGGAGVGSCQHAGPPDKPSVVNAGGDLDLVFALRQIASSLTTDAGVEVPGYDIDKTCTCHGENDSCLEPSWATASHCDDPIGRDNAGSQLILAAAAYIPELREDRWNADLERGAWTTLARIQNYNGKPDDDQVIVSFYVGDAFWHQSPAADGGEAHPKWDGTDAWPIVNASLEPVAQPDGGQGYDLNRPLHKDEKAYVSGGVVVAMLPRGVLQIDPKLKLVFTDLFVTGQLVQNAKTWSFTKGTMAGVWTMEDIFDQLGYVEFNGMSLCKGNPAYDIVKNIICGHVDIYRGRGTPTTPCDSVSIGMAFGAEQAQLGTIVPPHANSKKCPAATDPATDTCGP